jgi:hypothetical protein
MEVLAEMKANIRTNQLEVGVNQAKADANMETNQESWPG